MSTSRPRLSRGLRIGLSLLPFLAAFALFVASVDALRAEFTPSGATPGGPSPMVVVLTNLTVCRAWARGRGEWEKAELESCQKREAIQSGLSLSPRDEREEARFVAMGIPADDVEAMHRLGISQNRDIRLIHQTDAEYQALKSAGSFGRCSTIRVDRIVNRRGNWTLFEGGVDSVSVTCPQSRLFTPLLRVVGLLVGTFALWMVLWWPARRSETAAG